jgi:hypothetical protein
LPRISCRTRSSVSSAGSTTSATSNDGERVAFQASERNADPWRSVAADGSEVDRSI